MPPPTIGELEFHERLGKGASGVVYRAVRRKDGKQVAVKEIDLSELDPEEKEKYVKMMLVEVEALAKMQSPFIIRYYGSFMHEERIYIVTEYAEKGDLHCYLRSQASPLPEPTIWRLLIQATMGLHHMHSKRILHRDVKSLNIFLDARYDVKIGDMGISKIMGTMTNFASTLVGTPYYLSPELCEGLCYDEKSDMWALGIVLYECCTCGKKPFDADSLGPLVMQIMTGTYSSIQGYSEELLQVIDGLLAHSAEDRLDTHALLSSTIFRSKAEEVGIDLSQAARDLSVVELESHVMRFSMSESNSGFDSKKMSKGPPKIQARGARMTKGSSSDDPFNGRCQPPGSWPGANTELNCLKEDNRKLWSTIETANPLSTVPSSSRADNYSSAASLTENELNTKATEMLTGEDGDALSSHQNTEDSIEMMRTHIRTSNEGDLIDKPAETRVQFSETVSDEAGYQNEKFQASSGQSAVLAKLHAEELPETDRAKAVHFARLAIQEDERGAFENAFQLYQECLKYFEKELQKISTNKQKVREVLTKKMVAYLERAEYLKQVLATRNLYRTASARGRRR